jgi:hypothetical protein
MARERERAHPPALDGAARQGRLLGHRDQARPGARPRGLSRLYAQGRDGCLLHGLRQGAAGECEGVLPTIRHAQCADHRLRVRARRRCARFRVPAPARHGGSALSRRRGPTQGRLPRLCAGRQPRGSPALSRAPPARERRQQLVREPHRRRGAAGRGAGRKSDRALAREEAHSQSAHTVAARAVRRRARQQPRLRFERSRRARGALRGDGARAVGGIDRAACGRRGARARTRARGAQPQRRAVRRGARCRRS